MAQTFVDALKRCIPEGVSEEAWAVKNGLNARTLRRAKSRAVKFQAGSLRQLAVAMRALGGTLQQRIEQLRELTAPEPRTASKPRRARARLARAK